jgi:glucose/arabinose dehydrogenase
MMLAFLLAGCAWLAVVGLLTQGPLTQHSVQAASPSDPVTYEPLPPDVKVETVVASAVQVVAMDFTPDGRLLYTERTGNLRVVVNGQAPQTIFRFPVLTEGERGLLGVAVDPNFATNHFVWIFLTKRSSETDCGGTIKNRVVRLTLADDNTIAGEQETAGCFPVNQPAPNYYVSVHNGGNLHFGPDGKLYVTVGNGDDVNDNSDPAQRLDSPLGKLHRYNPTVPLSVPPDNPFVHTPNAVPSIYAHGLRNSFDFDFDPIGGGLFATENGDDCDDEINRLVRGGNYGWRPNYPCEDAWPGGPDPNYNTLPPLIYWTPSLAPTGITFYTGTTIPEWQGDLFMCSFKDATSAIHHFKLNSARTAIVSHTILTDTVTRQRIKCRTDPLPGPDGALYFSEGGGWINGPIKRLIRRSSFAATTVNPQRLNPAPGSLLDYTIDLRHNGILSKTFVLTAVIPSAYAQIEQVEAAAGNLNMQPYLLTWTGTLTGTEVWTATYRLQLSAVPTTAYPLTNAVRLTAPGLAAVVLTPTVIVNGLPLFLPVLARTP